MKNRLHPLQTRRSMVALFIMAALSLDAEAKAPEKACSLEHSTWRSSDEPEHFRISYDAAINVGRAEDVAASVFSDTLVEFDKTTMKAVRIEKWKNGRRVWRTYAAQICMNESRACYLSFPTGRSSKSAEALIKEPVRKLEVPLENAEVSWITTFPIYVPDEKRPRFLAIANVVSLSYSAPLIVDFDLGPGAERENESNKLSNLSFPEVFRFFGCRKTTGRRATESRLPSGR